MAFFYQAGKSQAYAKLGLIKQAFRRSQTEESGVSASVPIGVAAAATPFGGLIGQKRIRHDPLMGAEGTRFKSLADLSAAAQPGDILLTAKPKESIWRNFQLPITGTEWYHAQGVADAMPGRRIADFDDLLEEENEVLVDELFGMSPDELEETLSPAEKKEALRRAREAVRRRGITFEAGDISIPAETIEEKLVEGLGPGQILTEEGQVQDIVNALKKEDYQNVALLRPTKPLTSKELQVFQDQMLQRAMQPYENPKALEIFLKDLFVPNIKGMKRLMGTQEITCKGNVCSTMPSQAYTAATGEPVISTKRPQDVMPADYMRSDKFKLVGHHLADEFPMHKGFRKALPYLTRGGIGLGLGAAAYTGAEDPTLLAAVPGAAGAYLGAKALSPKIKSIADKGMFPGVSEGVSITKELMSPSVTRKAKFDILKPILKGGLPTAAAGATLGVLGAKGIQHLVNSHTKKSKN